MSAAACAEVRRDVLAYRRSQPKQKNQSATRMLKMFAQVGLAVCSAIQRMKSSEPSLTGKTSKAGLV
jgi:hypothetical protein